MKFCILMPAYNAEKDIAKAIESVLEQTYDNFSLIIVNDGSADGTQEAIEGFLEDDRIISLSQNNTGIAGAYKNAFQHLDGDYIMFLDSDDALEKNALFEIKQTIDKSNADIVQFGISYFNEHWQHICDLLFEEKQLFDNNVILTDYFTGINNGQNRPNLGIRAYKKELLHSFEFPPIASLGIDEILNLYAMTHCNNLYYMNQSFYLCQGRQQSVSRIQPSLNKVKGILLSYDEMEKVVEAQCPTFKDMLYVKFLKFYISHLNLIKKLPSNKERKKKAKLQFSIIKRSKRIHIRKSLLFRMSLLVYIPFLSLLFSKY